MAIYGIGANHSGEDVSTEFIRRGIACVGWDEVDAPTLYSILRHIKVGDLIYIKSYPPNVGLIIKAVGVIVDPTVLPYPNYGNGLLTRWIWSGEERYGIVDDKYPVRANTIYEEYNYDIQSRILRLLFHFE